MFKFEELNVYKKSKESVNSVYKITKTWPKDEMYGLTDQIRRAAVSISLNIAEGSSRRGTEFGHFIDIAKGSCYECVAIMEIAKSNNYLNTEIFQEMYSRFEELARMLSSLKNSLHG
jgi:four helix bundle protein